MIFRNKEELAAKYLGTAPIAYIYLGGELVWSSVSSCFGSGMWLNDKVWKNDDAWKN